MPPITIESVYQVLLPHNTPLKMDTNALTKRGDSSDRFSLYVFAIIVGCVAFVLIGCSLWAMYNGIDEEKFQDVPYEQRKYMREVRQRNLNVLAYTARRPDMVIPVEQLNY